MKKEVFDAGIIQDIKNDTWTMKKELVFGDKEVDRIMGYCDNMIDNMLIMINRLIDVEFDSYNEFDSSILKSAIAKVLKGRLYKSLSKKIGDYAALINRYKIAIFAEILKIPEEVQDYAMYTIRQQNNCAPRSGEDGYGKKINNVISTIKTLSERITDTIN